MTENILEYDSGLIAARLERSEKALVTGVSFRLSAGERLSLIGETGSGKTMTALSIMGLLPGNVTMRGGSVRFLGEELTGCGSIRQLLGDSIVYIPQNGSEFLNPSRKVRHHLYDSLKKLGVRKPDLERTALEKLELAGFSQPQEVLEKYPFQLSGGMAQRHREVHPGEAPLWCAAAGCGRNPLGWEAGGFRREALVCFPSN